MTRRPRHSGFTLVELLVVIAALMLLLGILLPSLGRARRLARKTACASNLRQLAMANMGYAAENRGRFALAAEDMGGRHAANCKRWHGERATWNDPFDPELSPLAGYLGDGAVKECPSFVPDADESLRFEKGAGGYGYNNYAVGARMDSTRYEDPYRRSASEYEVARPGATVMFTDAALAQGDGEIIDYSFCVSPRTREGDRLSASIHFRHGEWANVAWVDGSVESRTMTFTAAYGVYGVGEAEARRLGFGWFGPDSNELFDLE